MKFVTFTDNHGAVVSINPAHISSVVETPGNPDVCVIYFTDNRAHYQSVPLSRQYVVDYIERATQHEPPH